MRNEQKTRDRNLSGLEEARPRVAELKSAVIQRAAEGLCVCHAIEEYPYVKFTLWNDRMAEITGYTMEEINRLGWYQTMYPDSEVQTRAIERMESMRGGDDIIAEEWKITRADGEKRMLSISTSILPSVDGTVHVLALMHDVTQQKRAQENFTEGAKLLEHNSLVLEVMTGQMTDMVYYKDRDFRYIFSSKPHCERILKCSQEECIGKTDVEIADLARNRGHRQDFGEICINSDSETMKAGKPSKFIEEGIIDDEYICLEVYKTPIYDEQGFSGIVGCSRDITERREIEEELRKYRDHLEELVEERTTELKRANEQLQDEIAERERAEEAYRESEANYRAIVEAFDGLVYVCSQDYRIEFLNEQFIERTGYDATGDRCYKALHDLDSICSWCVNERVFKGETVRWEVQSPKDNRWY